MVLRDYFVKLLSAFGKENACSECGKEFLTDEGVRRHVETDHVDEFIVFRCTECGRIYQSISGLHAHADGHTPFYSMANVDRLMKYTEKLKVTDFEELDARDNYNGGENLL